MAAQNFDAKLFDPVLGPHGVFGVHTSRTMQHLSLLGRLTTSYANDEVLLRSLNQQDVRRPIAHRLTAELGLAMGVLGWLEFGVALPLYLYQSSEGYTPGPGGGLSAGGQGATLLGDMRLVAKAQFLDNRKFSGLGLGLVLEVSFPTGSRDALAGDASVTFTPQIVADYRHRSGFVIALNLAYRLRGQEKFFDLTIDDELRVSLGTEIPLFFSRFSLLGEMILAVGIPQFSEGGGITGQLNLSTELRTGLRWRHQSGMIATLGVGFGVTGGFGAPDFRLVLDISFGRNVRTGLSDEPLPPEYPMVAQGTKVEPKSPQTNASQPPVRRVVAVKPPPPQTKVALSADVFDRSLAKDKDADSDGDGIPDVRDKCPYQPETFNGIDDEDGCPDEQKPVKPVKVQKSPYQIVFAKGELKISEKVFFRSGSDEIQKRSYGILRHVVQFLRQNPQIRLVLIEGHTDSRGDQEMNVDLSERRARQVMAFLVRQGVEHWKLQAKGWGPKYPVASNNTSKGRAENRRVVFKVLRLFVLKKPVASTKKDGGQ